MGHCGRKTRDRQISGSRTVHYRNYYLPRDEREWRQQANVPLALVLTASDLGQGPDAYGKMGLRFAAAPFEICQSQLCG
jgi:hypothetical protein